MVHGGQGLCFASLFWVNDAALNGSEAGEIQSTEGHDLFFGYKLLAVHQSPTKDLQNRRSCISSGLIAKSRPRRSREKFQEFSIRHLTILNLSGASLDHFNHLPLIDSPFRIRIAKRLNKFNRLQIVIGESVKFRPRHYQFLVPVIWPKKVVNV